MGSTPGERMMIKKSNQMQPVKKDYIPGIRVKDPEGMVYEGEIIDRDEIADKVETREKTSLVKKEENLPDRGFAYNLGRFAGSLISAVGLLGDVVSLFKSGKPNPGRNCRRGGGARRRQRKGKRCFNR